MITTLDKICILGGGTGFPDKYQGNKQGDYPFIKVSDMSLRGNERHIIRANNYINEASRQALGAKVFGKGATVFAKVGAALNLNRRRMLVDYTLIDNNMMAATPIVGKVLPEYLYYCLSRIDLGQISQVGSLPSVNQKQVGSIRIFCHEKTKEQQKIADCLSSVDNLIFAQSKKIKVLHDHKKGLMQLLFPAEGKTLPNLRFPEFNGSWKKKRLGDVFSITRGQVLAMSEVKPVYTDQHPYPVYSSQTLDDGLAGYFKSYLYSDAITWTTDGANAGETRFRRGPFYCTNVCGVLLNDQGWANKCVAEIINSITKRYVSYVGNPKLMNDVMSKIVVALPHPDEQAKIAAFLRAVDELIVAEIQKMEALKDHKKGLMQLLFPQQDNEVMG